MKHDQAMPEIFQGSARRLSMPRVALLFGTRHEAFAQRCANELNVVGAVFEHRSLRYKLRALLKRIARHGPRRVVGQVLLRLMRIFLMNRRSTRFRPTALVTPRGAALPEHHVKTVNSPEVARVLEKWNPEIVVVYGTSLIQEPLLRALPERSYNIHTGLTEHYRGMSSTFWALYDGHPEYVGATIHLVGSGIDTGAIVATVRPDARFVETCPTLGEIDEIVAKTAENTLLNLLKGDASIELKPGGSGRLHSDPTLREYLALRRRTGIR